MNDMDILKEINSICENMESYCSLHDGDMVDFFADGSIYGETADGELIVGFGVFGSANILLCENCVKCGNYVSKEFSPMLKNALADFRSIFENC